MLSFESASSRSRRSLRAAAALQAHGDGAAPGTDAAGCQVADARHARARRAAGCGAVRSTVPIDADVAALARPAAVTTVEVRRPCVHADLSAAGHSAETHSAGRRARRRGLAGSRDARLSTRARSSNAAAVCWVTREIHTGRGRHHQARATHTRAGDAHLIVAALMARHAAIGRVGRHIDTAVHRRHRARRAVANSRHARAAVATTHSATTAVVRVRARIDARRATRHAGAALAHARGAHAGRSTVSVARAAMLAIIGQVHATVAASSGSHRTDALP